MNLFILPMFLTVMLCAAGPSIAEVMESVQQYLILEKIVEDIANVMEKLESQQTILIYLEESQRTTQEHIGGLQTKLTRLEGQQLTLENLEGQQENLARIEESQRTIHDKMEEIHGTMEASFQVQHLQTQECAKENQLEAIHNASVIEREEVMSYLARCTTVDQITDLKNLLATDECEIGNHKCSSDAACVDGTILYTCTCLPGFSGNGFICRDVDECFEGIFPCALNEVCSNTEGGYECVCPDGYTTISGSCLACENPSLYIDGLGCVSPQFTRMSWRNSQEKCQEFGKKLLENFNKEHIEIMKQHFQQLPGFRPYPWVGIKDGTWVSTGELLPEHLWAQEKDNYQCGSIHFDSNGVIDYSCSDVETSLCH